MDEMEKMDPIYGIPIYYAVCFAVLIIFSLALCCRKCPGNAWQGVALALRCFDERSQTSQTVVEVLDRFKNQVMSYLALQGILSVDVYFSLLMQGVNQHLAKFCIHYIPSGSMAEGYGAERDSASPLASDIDLMLVPSGSGLLAGTSPDLLFKVEQVKPDNTANYIQLQLNPNHPAGEQWKEMCNFERNGRYLSNARVRMALGNALRADWFSKGTILFSDKRIVIAQQGPALNVKIQDVHNEPPAPQAIVISKVHQGCNCWGLVCFLGCLISPLILMVGVYAIFQGKSISELFAVDKRPKTEQGQPNPAHEVVVVDPLTPSIKAAPKPKIHFEADFVFALPMEWPVDRTWQWEEAAKRSVWLSDEVIVELKKLQCYAVPKPPASPFGIQLNKKNIAAWNPDGSFFKIGESTEGGDGLPWRMSFSKQEEALADLIAEKWPYARLGFIGVKAAIKAKISGLQSYAVKTAFLLFMESRSQEQLDKVKKVEPAPAEQLSAAAQPQPARAEVYNLEPLGEPPLQPQEEIFYQLIDFIVQKLEERSMPHYFIRETNLMEELNKDVRTRLNIIATLRDLRIHPVERLAITRTYLRRGCCSCQPARA